MLDMLLILFSVLTFTTAQTYTACNPLNGTGCPVDTALSTNATFDFRQNIASATVWNTTAGPITYTSRGAEFAIQAMDMSPTIQSNFYIFFGRVEVVMMAAEGAGIVSSVVLQSDDLDEIDWEFIGSNATSVQSNYYGKGNHTTYDRVGYHHVSSPQTSFHNYTTIWTSDKLEWWIDGVLARTLNPADALGGRNYPQTPSQVKMGSWVGGKTGGDKGTIEWAGGLADFSKGQTYTMIVQRLFVQDYCSGKSYEYGDTSGDWTSIKSNAGTSPIAEYIWKPKGISGRWKALSKAAQIAILCVAIGAAAVLFLLLVFCCVKQRRAGRREKAIADAEFEKSTAELMAYPASGCSSRDFVEPGRQMKSGWL